jgi:hypothetical protein
LRERDEERERERRMFLKGEKDLKGFFQKSLSQIGIRDFTIEKGILV